MQISEKTIKNYNHNKHKNDTFTLQFNQMEIYHDLSNYYPLVEENSKRVYEAFKIFRLEDMELNRNSPILERLKKPHRRDFFEFSVVKKEIESTTVIIGNNKFQGVNNNMFFTSPNQVFSIDFGKDLESKKAEGFLVAFKPSFLLSINRTFQVMNTFGYYNLHTSPHYILNQFDLEQIIGLLNLIYTEYRSNEIFAEKIIKGYLEAILYTINRILESNPNRVYSSSSNNITTQFEQKIIESRNRIGTIQEYANALNISPNYLSVCVKKETNKSAKEILLNHKLTIAKSLLFQYEKNIADIAYEMGFSEPTNFTKFFKKMTKMTPNKFRLSL